MHILIFLFFLLSPAMAQQISGESTGTNSPLGSLPDYRLGPGDLLSVHVYGIKEFDHQARVSNSGRVHIPYVGIISVAGLTTNELESQIVLKLKEQHLVNEPWVRTELVECRSQPVFIVGEVNSPGQFMITSETRVLDIISKAGGLKGSAGPEIYLYRRNDLTQPRIEVKIGDETDQELQFAALSTPHPGASEPQPEKAIEINLNELSNGKRPDLNLKLQGGDVLSVTRRKRQNFFVLGDVIFPGSHTLPPNHNDLTAARAVAFAGGPLNTAKRKGFIMRHDQNGEVKVLEFDFGGVIKGQQADVPIQPDDIIVVPHDRVKTIGNSLLLLVPRMVQQFLIF